MKFVFYLISMIFFSSCSVDENDMFEFDPRNVSKTKINLSGIADRIDYIALDNTYPINSINDIKILNKHIYIDIKEVGLVRYNEKGDNPIKIGTIGRGPGEYLYCLSFCIDETTGKIFIRDINKTVSVYSKNGVFLSSIPLKNHGSAFRDIEIVKSKLLVTEYISFGEAKYNWIVVDTLNSIIDYKLNSIPAFKTVMGANGGVYKFSDRLYYWNCYNDTVFCLNNDFKPKVAFLFAKGNHRRPLEDITPQQLAANFFTPYKIFETNNYYFLEYFYLESYLTMIDKKTKLSYSCSLQTDYDGITINKIGGISNDIDGGIDMRPIYYFTENDDEFIVSVITPLKLKEHVNSDSFINSNSINPSNKLELENFASTLSVTDNPILMVVHLKK